MKLLYVIPDYQNPSGECMPIGNRLKLLELARKYNFLIIEDSVYNSFTYVQKRNPTLKSLDRYNRVIYVGSFSKSLFPGLRTGFIVADQQVENEDGVGVELINEMAKIKALITNNTSAVDQAILGGVLLSLNYSLSEWNKPQYENYKKKYRCMTAALDKCIRDHASSWAKDLWWNEPEGGFFIRMKLPFQMGNEEIDECAGKFGVIVCPMRYFYFNKGGEKEIRLAFSNLSFESIEEGISRLAAYLKYKIGTMETSLLEEVRAGNNY